MAQLTIILNSIKSWVQQQQPEVLKNIRLHPGLSPEQIEAELAELPYQLSSEIIELYQWHNGIGDGQSWSFLPFPEGDYGIQGFLSLGEAVAIALDWNDNVFPNMNVFPLFSVEEVMYWTIGSEELQDILPIYSGDDIDPPLTQQAPNLTAFLENMFSRVLSREA